MRSFLALSLLLCVAHAGESARESWARQLVDAVRAGDGERTMLLIDARAILERSTRDGPEDLKNGFVAGAMNALRKRGGVLHEVIPGVARGGRFDLLRIVETEGQPCARFRFASADGGVNYLDVRLRTDKGGEVRGTDLFNHMSGEWMSDTMRRFFLGAVQAQRRPLWKKLLEGEDKEWIRAGAEMKRMIALKDAGRSKEALEVYAAMPEGIRKLKSIQMVRLQVAQAAGEAEYQQAMREYLALYPDDPSVFLVGIDAHFLAGRHDAAIASVEALDKAIGGDPYLGLLKGNLLAAAGRYDEARKSIRAALKAGPDWTNGHFALIEIELDTKRYGEVLRLLIQLEEEFGYEFEDLTKHEVYAGFVKSPEYETWRKREPKKD